MGAQFETHALVLVPLTPIHVGGGEEARLLPEDYRLRDGHFERVSVRSVLARLPEGERAQWLRQMARATPEAMQQQLRRLQSMAKADDVLERIPISAESANALDLAGEGHDRLNQIDTFVRAGGRPCLPGSSVKGMLRTAWAAEMARTFGAPALPPLPAWKGMQPPERATQASALVAKLFDLSDGNRAQDTDPFRDVTVADAPLPEGATRIDKVRLWKRKPAVERQPAAYGFATVGKMHRERLRSVADGGEPPVIELTIGLRTKVVRRFAACRDQAKRPSRERAPDTLAALLAACESHHKLVWDHERQKFFSGDFGHRVAAALDLLSAFSRAGDNPEAALVRLGWGGHAEAKSLEGLRRVEERHAGHPLKFSEIGSTRKVIDLAGHPLPFGWALLIRAEAWAAKRPQTWLPPPAAGTGRGGAPSDPRAGTVLGQQVRYRRGQKVRVDGEVAELLEDVTAAMRPDDRVRIRLNGDTETIRVREIEGPA